MVIDGISLRVVTLVFVALGSCSHQYRTIVAGVPHKPRDLTGLVFMVTGANAGIGYQTALALVGMGGTVVMAGRSMSRMQAAKRSILEATKAAESKVICLECDLCDFASVRNCVEEFKKLGLPLNVLINNAGMMLQVWDCIHPCARPVGVRPAWSWPFTNAALLCFARSEKPRPMAWR